MSQAFPNRKVLKIEIDPDVIDKEDPEMMSDLITAAVNKALDKAEARGREELESATKGSRRTYCQREKTRKKLLSFYISTIIIELGNFCLAKFWYFSFLPFFTRWACIYIAP